MLDGGNVNEHIGGTIFRLDETEAFSGLEEFYHAVCHHEFLSIRMIKNNEQKFASKMTRLKEKSERPGRKVIR